MVYTISRQSRDAERMRQMTETKRLYYEDVYKKEFTAKVLECREAKKGFHIILDESAFYPEGGGQPSDTGYLNDVKVKEVHEKEGELLHYTDQPMEAGTEVQGRIDWARRFDLMQQHSGEHMVSGLIHEAYGYDNVGFHMGSDTITIDLNGPLDEVQLAEIERKTNQKIWEDTQIKIIYPTAEELEKIDYRSKKELTGQVRIVEFPGVDICACCGTHVTHTGEIGMVKLLSVEKFREGVRIEMICGKRVLDYLNMVNDQNHQISVKLSAKMDKTAQAVERLQEENFRLKGQVGQLVDDIVPERGRALCRKRKRSHLYGWNGCRQCAEACRCGDADLPGLLCGFFRKCRRKLQVCNRRKRWRSPSVYKRDECEIKRTRRRKAVLCTGIGAGI